MSFVFRMYLNYNQTEKSSSELKKDRVAILKHVLFQRVIIQ